MAAVYVPVNLEVNLETNLEVNLETNLESISEASLDRNLESISEVIQSSIAPQLAKYKIPKLWFPRSKLPRNAQGKINYQILRDELQLP